MPCRCASQDHEPRLIVVTGGPGAGKTAFLGVAARAFCGHVIALPESASILWSGGFPRHPTLPGRFAAQRAIVHVQRELEQIAIEERSACIVLCDRGTLDGLAYWPGDEARFFAELATTRARELARYATVLHLRPPRAGHGYPHGDPLRIESAIDAAAIDARIEAAWTGHPRRFFVESDDDFVVKLRHALGVIRAELPACCLEPARAA